MCIRCSFNRGCGRFFEWETRDAGSFGRAFMYLLIFIKRRGRGGRRRGSKLSLSGGFVVSTGQREDEVAI